MLKLRAQMKMLAELNVAAQLEVHAEFKIYSGLKRELVHNYAIYKISGNEMSQ